MTDTTETYVAEATTDETGEVTVEIVGLLDVSKPLLSSVGVWGSIVAIIAGIAGLYGYAISAETALELTQLLSALFSSIGGLFALYGRIRARQVIA